MHKLAVLLLTSLAFTACTSDGGGDEPYVPPPGDTTYTCTATIEPFEYGYVMLDTDLMEVSAQGQTAIYSRVGSSAGGLPVHGVWHVGQQTTAEGYLVSVDLRIDALNVAALVDCDFGGFSLDAVASSPATVTDSIIRGLQSDRDEQVTRR